MCHKRSPHTTRTRTALSRVLVATVAVLCLAPASSFADLLWASRFETEGGVPVAHGQAASNQANAIDNEVGPGGTALVTMTYAEYAQPDVPDLPGDDLFAEGRSFALAFPASGRPGINTNLPSNTGNLANAASVGAKTV